MDHGGHAPHDDPGRTRGLAQGACSFFLGFGQAAYRLDLLFRDLLAIEDFPGSFTTADMLGSLSTVIK